MAEKVTVYAYFFCLLEFSHMRVIKKDVQRVPVMCLIAFLCYELFPPPATIKVALNDMDREMRDEYLVVIQAKDMGGHMGGLSGTTSLTVTLIDINDNPPKFSKSKKLHKSRTQLITGFVNEYF